MSGNIKMKSALPAGDGNGLVRILSELVRDKNTQFVTIAIVDCPEVRLNKDTGEKVPQARIRRIEVVLDDEDMKVARRLMERALAQRTGREALPYDLEAELDEVFANLDVTQIEAEEKPPEGEQGGTEG